MSYPHSPLFKFDAKDFYEFILRKRPSLRGQKIACEVCGKGGVIFYFNMTDKEIMKYN